MSDRKITPEREQEIERALSESMDNLGEMEPELYDGDLCQDTADLLHDLRAERREREKAEDRVNCQIPALHQVVSERDSEIARLRARITELGQRLERQGGDCK